MRHLYRKDDDFLLADAGQEPPAGYIPADHLPPAADTIGHTYHWLRGDGCHKSTRYELLRESGPFRVNGRRRYVRKPRNRDRRRLQAQLYRARRHLAWLEKPPLWPPIVITRIAALRKKINKINAKLLTSDPE